MENQDEVEYRTLWSDRARLFELVIPSLTHEINNRNQTILSSAQVLFDILAGIKRIIDHYYEEHGDFIVGGMQYSTLKDELENYINDIIHGAECIDKSVSALRTFGQPAIVIPQSVNLNRLIDTASSLLANLIRRSVGRFNLELSPGLPEIEGKSQWLLQAVLYLIINACQGVTDRNQPLSISTRYNEKQGVVVCTATYGGNEAVPGISEEAAMEWAKVTRIVEKFKGSFELKSEPKTPTRAVIYLPVPARIG